MEKSGERGEEEEHYPPISPNTNEPRKRSHVIKTADRPSSGEGMENQR